MLVQNLPKLLIYSGLILSLILTLSILFRFIRNFQKNSNQFLFSLPNATSSQLRGPLMQNQMNLLLNNLSTMKKFIGWSFLAVILTVLILGSLTVYDSREYFKEYFEVKRDKLNLRNEASVDSLQLFIVDQNVYIDSLEIKLNSVNEMMYTNKIILKETQKSVNNLQNVIKHQNQMITNLKTDNNELKSLIKKLNEN